MSNDASDDERPMPFGGTWLDLVVVYAAYIYAGGCMLAGVFGVAIAFGPLAAIPVWLFAVWVAFSGFEAFIDGLLELLAELRGVDA